MPMATAIKLATFCGFSPPFFNPPPEGRLQNRDVKGDKAGDKGMEITTANYISLLEETVELQRWQIEANKVEWEKYKILEEAIRTQGEKVKKQIETEVKKILTKPRTSKKK